MSKAEDRANECFPNEDIESKKARFGFLLGYHQAEKDLSDISWIKEVSGVKEMSRAKEEALKAYPPQCIAANYDIIDRRDAFEYGYLKAEKDNELTWEDAKEIYCIALNLREHLGASVFGEPLYQEVLKRFKDFKERRITMIENNF